MEIDRAIENLKSMLYELRGENIDEFDEHEADIDRQEFYKNPKKILGKQITVQYFEETENEKGGISLRFPTFKILHGSSRSI